MLIEFFYSLPIFLMLFYGAVHVSELGFLVGATEESSFYAARSKFINGDIDQAVRDYSRAAIHPLNESSKVNGKPVDLTVTRATDGKSVSVNLAYPELIPMAKKIFGTRLPTYTAKSVLPLKEEE